MLPLGLRCISPSARKKLYLTNAFTRQIFGQSSANRPRASSVKFRWNCARALEWALLDSLVLAGKSAVAVAALPALVPRRAAVACSVSRALQGRALVSRQRSAVKPEAQKKAAAKMTFTKGDTVDHKVFGRGTITKVDGDTLHVRFSRTGQTQETAEGLRTYRKDRLMLRRSWTANVLEGFWRRLHVNVRPSFISRYNR